MPITCSYYSLFLYVFYKRETNNDIDKMKKILKKFIDIELPQNPRDIVINFDDSKIISSPEIGILASAVVELKKSSNKLIVISTKELRNIISSTNIDRFSNLVFGEKNFLSGGGLK